MGEISQVTLETVYRHLPDARDGELSIRLITGATTTPPPDFAVEFFNPLYELQSLDRAFRFFSAKLEALSGLDPELGREIARHMAHIAHGYVCGVDRLYGLSMSVELQTASAAEGDEQAPPPSAAPAPDLILGSIVSNEDDDRNGECCSVCLEGFEREEVITHLALCLHKFHSECIINWLLRKRTCPICRRRVYFRIRAETVPRVKIFQKA